MLQTFQGIVLREIEKRDMQELKQLWCSVFCHPPELVDAFFSLLPEMGCGCAAVHGGHVLGAAYLIHGFTLVRPHKAPVRCGYLYAVAVDPAARGQGIGAAVSRGAAELGKQHGAELICTLPADESLYRWYGNTLAMTYRSSRRVFYCDRLPEAQMLAAPEYLLRREAVLNGIPHVLPAPPVMEFEAALCRLCDGGLYTAGDILFFAYRDRGRWLIPELLPLSAADRLPGVSTVSLPYLCADRPLPENLLWNLTFD